MSLKLIGLALLTVIMLPAAAWMIWYIKGVLPTEDDDNENYEI